MRSTSFCIFGENTAKGSPNLTILIAASSNSLFPEVLLIIISLMFPSLFKLTVSLKAPRFPALADSG